MKIIRNGVFETNSSSTHCLSIQRTQSIDIEELKNEFVNWLYYDPHKLDLPYFNCWILKEEHCYEFGQEFGFWDKYLS